MVVIDIVCVQIVGHFLLTHLLADLLFAGAPSRVVMVAAVSYNWASIDFDDINMEKSYSIMSATVRSKLSNVLFANELGRRAQGLLENVCCGMPEASSNTVC
jgi:retinol dehydrogenase-14